MKKSVLLMLSSVLIIMLASCNKEKDHSDTGSTTGIQGTYKLKYITLKNNGTETVLNRKTVDIANDTSFNNGGTLVIDASNLTANSFTYELSGTPIDYTYTDNVLVDSMKSSFSIKYPATNSSTTYKLVGTDSIYFPQGSPASAIFSISSGSGGTYGGKYNVSGNLLTIIQTNSIDSSFQLSGLTYTIKGTEIASMVMEKQ